MFEKRCEHKELLRDIRADIINFSGMGAKKYTQASDISPLPLLDNMNVIVPIRNDNEAHKLLKEFETTQWQD